MYLRLFIFVISAVLAVIEPAIVGTTPSSAATAGSATRTLPLFASESAAQAHCPRDVVVWLNTASGIYHLKGERWYRADEAGGIRVQARGRRGWRSRDEERPVRSG